MIMPPDAATVYLMPPDAATVYLALIAASAGVLSPVLLAILTNRFSMAKQQADYARQDLVAARAAQASKDLLAKQDILAEKVVNQTAKLDQIHALVNSNLTASLQDQLDTRRANVVLLRRMPSPSKEETGLITAGDIKVAELTAQLADRLKATDMATKQLELDTKK